MLPTTFGPRSHHETEQNFIQFIPAFCWTLRMCNIVSQFRASVVLCSVLYGSGLVWSEGVHHFIVLPEFRWEEFCSLLYENAKNSQQKRKPNQPRCGLVKPATILGYQKQPRITIKHRGHLITWAWIRYNTMALSHVSSPCKMSPLAVVWKRKGTVVSEISWKFVYS